MDFIALILDMIEFNASRSGWTLPGVLVKLLLAYNMQFDSNNIYSNVTILAISRAGDCKFLMSRLIEWLQNKGAYFYVIIRFHWSGITVNVSCYSSLMSIYRFSIDQCLGSKRFSTSVCNQNGDRHFSLPHNLPLVFC